MSTTVPDRIEKRAVLRATRARVWRALTDAGEFGKWFGVLLEGSFTTVVESGFDRIPLARRAEAFRLNDGGWTEQLRNIERHVARQ